MTDHEREPDASASDDESAWSANEPKLCANCGAEIDVEEWHPVTTRTDDDGNFRLYAFCGERCRDAWVSE